MTAKLTITLSDDVLKALKASKSISVALQSGGGGGRAPRGAPARSAGGGGGRKAGAGAGGFRAGSLPAKLLAWAGGRKKPFGVPDLMSKFKIKRGHASMLVSYVLKAGAVKRVGRGAYTT
jgi:hypothetical protein